MNESKEYLKLDCLKLASANNRYVPDILKAAEMYYDFIMGSEDKMSAFKSYLLNNMEHNTINDASKLIAESIFKINENKLFYLDKDFIELKKILYNTITCLNNISELNKK